MKKNTALLRIENVYLLLLLFIACGCAGPKIATDLLVHTNTNEKPLTSSSSSVHVEINPSINNYENLDQSVKQSLRIAITSANIFGTNLSKPYRIDANILEASQSPFSFGSFKGKLEIRYMVYDPNRRKILDKTIFTVAGADKWSFVGARRHRRARAVNISKNVLEFVDILEDTLQREGF